MIHLAGEWDNFAAHAESDYTIHSNIRSSSAGLAVRNELTGEVIGHITGQGENTDTLTIGGRQHRATQQDQAIVVTPVADQAIESREDTPKYGGRRRRVSEAFAAHVRAGCDIGSDEAPIVATPNGLVWFHFGGELFEAASRALFPNLLGASVMTGIALRVIREFDSNSLRSPDLSRLTRFIESEGLRPLEDEGLGRFAENLPEQGVVALLSALRVRERFTEWITSRQVIASRPICEWKHLKSLLADD